MPLHYCIWRLEWRPGLLFWGREAPEHEAPGGFVKEEVRPRLPPANG
jgi:hypothetical protein